MYFGSTMNDKIPIFPLPLVLLPGEKLPLHIFEEKYKKMIEYCLKNNQKFGIINSKNSDSLVIYKIKNTTGEEFKFLYQNFLYTTDSLHSSVDHTEKKLAVNDSIKLEINYGIYDNQGNALSNKTNVHYSLDAIKQLYSKGHATKDDYTKALLSYQAYLGEIKSDQRDKAAAAHEDFCYYV